MHSTLRVDLSPLRKDLFCFSNTSLCRLYIRSFFVIFLDIGSCHCMIMHPYFPNIYFEVWAYYIFRIDCCKHNLFLHRFGGATFMHCIGWSVLLATPRYSEGGIHVCTNCYHLALLHWWNWIVQYSSLEPTDLPSALSILYY
jgi:hypothetical protein